MPSRRTLLKWMGAAATLPAWLRSAPSRYELMTVPVAGFQHHEGTDDAVAAMLREGADLVLRREPENPHDAKATAVHTRSGHQIGYVPRRWNAIPARLADQGVTLRARLTRFDAEAPAWERAEIRVSQEV